MKEFFARLNPTERRFVVIVAVVFFLVINIVWVWPRFADWGATKKKLNTARDLVAKFDQGIDRIPELRRQIGKYQKQGEVVPADDQAVRFFRIIQSEATRSGVMVTSMGSGRQTTAANNPFFLEQSQTIVVNSGEKQLVDFLYNLGAGESLIRVKVLSVVPDPPRQGLSAHITLVASYQKKALAAGAATPARASAPVSAPTTAPAPAQAPAPKPVVVAPKMPPTNHASPTLPLLHNPLTPSKK